MAYTYGTYFGGGTPSSIKDEYARRLFESTANETIKLFAEKKDWVSQFNYGGDDSFAENIRKQYKQKQPESLIGKLNKQTLKRRIDTMKDLIRNKGIKSGEQILLILDTHGNPSANGQSHTIETVDGPIDLKDLQELALLAKQHKVHLGIIDQSCFSQTTLNLANEYTCVISGSTEDTPSMAGATRDMIRALSNSENLEEAFLKARANTNINATYALPQISTPEGKEIFEYLKFTDHLHVPVGAEAYFKFDAMACSKKSFLVDLAKLDQKLNSAFDMSLINNAVVNYLKLNAKRSDKSNEQEKKELDEAATNILIQERLVYQKLYKKIKTKKANACNQFKLKDSQPKQK